jgi:hypothetical protein
MFKEMPDDKRSNGNWLPPSNRPPADAHFEMRMTPARVKRTAATTVAETVLLAYRLDLMALRHRATSFVAYVENLKN